MKLSVLNIKLSTQMSLKEQFRIISSFKRKFPINSWLPLKNLASFGHDEDRPTHFPSAFETKSPKNFYSLFFPFPSSLKKRILPGQLSFSVGLKVCVAI